MPSRSSTWARPSVSEPMLVDGQMQGDIVGRGGDLGGGAGDQLADHRVETGVVAHRVVDGKRARRAAAKFVMPP